VRVRPGQNPAARFGWPRRLGAVRCGYGSRQLGKKRAAVH
jgi:hypothetical protein